MNPPVTIRTLTDGGQTPAEVATQIAQFLDRATRTLDLAQYDFDLGPESARIVGDAIRRAHDRGVRVRLVYNVDHRNPIPVPPPCSPDEELIRSLPLEATAVAGVPDLMHHKYIVCDEQAVWTGSTNWTDDSWSRQENVIAIVESNGVAVDFRRDFEQLETLDAVADTGGVTPAWHDGIRSWFTPKHGEDLSHRIALAIAHAKRRVRVCSPVITAAPVLGALAYKVSVEFDVAGCVDETQRPSVARMGREPGGWKLPLLRARRTAGSSRRSTRRPTVPGRARLHAREAHRRRRHRRSSVRSTSHARASGTPRTCSRSRTLISRTGWLRLPTRCAPAIRG